MFFAETPEIADAYAETIGYAAYLLAYVRVTRRYALSFMRFADLVHEIVLAMRLRQFRMFRNEDGSPVGIAFWAWVSPGVVRDRQHSDGVVRLHPYEWMEGEELFLFDFVFPFGKALESVRPLIGELLPDGGTVFWINHRTQRLIAKEIQRHKVSFVGRCLESV